MSYTVAICDDEARTREHICDLVMRWASERKNDVHINTYENAEEYLFSENAVQSDILLLDIEMGKINGINLAHRVRDRDKNMQIVFITGYPDYIAEGYDVAALHYLMKPVDTGKLFSVLDRAVSNMEEKSPAVMLETENGPVRLYSDDIIFVEAFAHRSELTCKSGVLRLNESISHIEERLGSGFVRCHRSFVVNLRWVSQFTKTDVILDNGRAIPLSRRMANDVRREFISYYRSEADETV